MAFHFPTFRTRAITAIVFVLVMLGGLLGNPWSFLLLFSIIHFGCWYEYDRLIGKIEGNYSGLSKIFRLSVVLLGWGFMLRIAGDSYRIGNTALPLVGEWVYILSLLMAVLTFFGSRKKGNNRLLAYSLIGLIYISLSCGTMMRLWGNMHQQVFTGPNWLLPVIIIASIWINDTMAYIVGSFFGKTPLSPVSPKKTWEGTVGGAILAVVTVSLCGHYFFQLPILQLVIIAATASITGTLGDLFESKLKRMANVKDSGNFMPGHGGFLDRFDSLLFAGIYVYLVLRLVIFLNLI